MMMIGRNPGARGWELKGSRCLVFCSRRPTLGCQRAFTLIEIMVAIGIVAVIMTIAIPFMGQQLHKDSMRQAVADISEACGQARARAILNGVPTEVRIRPADRSISAVEAGGARSAMPSFGADAEPVATRSGGGGGIFSAKLSDHIFIEFIGVNLIPDLQQLEEVSCMFYPNGTSDELVVLIRSDKGEIRKITTEVVTGIPDVEVVR
jgi:prepilin-type N-terminal cleavage/methylation domain-containing protein